MSTEQHVVDIVKRLRQPKVIDPARGMCREASPLEVEAAYKIERLERELADTEALWRREADALTTANLALSESQKSREAIRQAIDKAWSALGIEGHQREDLFLWEAIAARCTYAEALTRAIKDALVSLEIVGDELDDNADVKDGPDGVLQPDWVMMIANSQQIAIATLKSVLAKRGLQSQPNDISTTKGMTMNINDQVQTQTSGASIGGGINLKEQQERYEAENARRLRFDTFATILSQRPEVTPTEAAELAVKVYDTLR